MACQDKVIGIPECYGGIPFFQDVEVQILHMAVFMQLRESISHNFQIFIVDSSKRNGLQELSFERLQKQPL